ncbi:hypothetical protein [Streptomyces sp. AK02-01A]|uniref:hypothetical protein n=1 Tax=Streptomyces sp. AK02-01A TaxID=3028648 RepID=UPI0029AF3527|nr:hypothetical protein [Streptomyces sp. AK02-01A]MDX3853637.1 hypothetical protein [Streptomyces sp. AK02-01A]
MNKLLKDVIAAHGGLDRWNEFSTLTARVRGGGALWTIKGQEGVMDDVTTTIDLRRQFTSHTPFGGPGLRGSFTPGRVAVEKDTGQVVEERFAPRESFAGHIQGTPWDLLHVAYFTGYAMWTYLTEPFSLAQPGAEVEEIDPWDENGETWRRLRVVFPEEFAAHCRENVYYVDDKGLIRRHDYVAEVLGSDPAVAAHYISDHRDVNGIVVPAARRVFLADEDGRPRPEPLIVSIGIEDVRLT